MSADDKPADQTADTTKTEKADAGANAAEGAANKADAPIPPPPVKSSAAKKPATTKKPAAAKAKAGANADFKEPGSTLNPADPAAPNYAFQPAGGDIANLGADQSIDQGTSEQPPSIGVADPVEAADDLVWSDEKGPRGRVISVSRGGDGGPTTTFEEALPAEGTPAQVGLVKERLRRRLGS